MHLVNGSRVVIVGGGPAGSFAAIHLLRLSQAARLDLEVIIYEPRDFNRPGPGGCNKCAGILSSTFLSNLEAIGLHLPAEVVQAELDTYVLHLGETELPIHAPQEEPGFTGAVPRVMDSSSPRPSRRRIVSVYRGSGPRWGDSPFPISFDGWLLDQARDLGAEIRRARVQNVKPGGLPAVITPRESLEVDLVVIATGINSLPPLDPAWGYSPPSMEVMAQTEVLLSAGSPTHSVHILFDRPPGLVFGGIIPKGRYANVSLLGKDLPGDSIAQFLDSHDLNNVLSDPSYLLCGCSPRIAVTPAAGYYNDRMVVVGDAAVTRLYKDGIGAAYLTARAAIHTAVTRGISRRDFARDYRPVCRQMALDNRYGRLLFRVWGKWQSSSRLMEMMKQIILAEAPLPPQKRVYEKVLWSTFTGDQPYRNIFSSLLSLNAMQSLARGMAKTWRKR